MALKNGAAARLQRLLPQSNRRAARQTLWLGGMTAAQTLGSLVQFSLAARILGPEDFGVLVIIIAAATLIFGLATMPGEEVITTYVTRSIAAGRRAEAGQVLRLALGAALGLRLLAYGLIALLTLMAAGLLDWVDAAYGPVLLTYSLTGILTAVSGESMAVLRLADRLRWGFGVVAASALAGVIALLGVGLAGGGLLPVALASVVKAAVLGGGLLLLAAVFAGAAGIPGLLRSWSVRAPRDIRRFQLAAFGRSSVEALHTQADALLLAGLTGPAQVGLYRAARYVIDAAVLPFRSLAYGVQAEYSRQWFGANGAVLRSLSRRFTLLAVVAAIGGYGLLFLLHQPIIRLLYGPEFAAAGSSLVIMLPGAAALAGLSALYGLPAAAGRAGPHLAALLAAVAAQAAVIFWLARGQGAEGAAIAFTIQALVFAAVILPAALRIFRQTYQLPAAEGGP